MKSNVSYFGIGLGAAFALVLAAGVAFSDNLGYQKTLASPATSATSVTKSDSTTYDPPLRGLYVGSGGNVAILLFDERNDPNYAVTFTNVADGSVLPVVASRVMSTNTTASGIVGLR